MRGAIVVDASVAVKWVYREDLSPQAVLIRATFDLVAPDLILAECANILWKKVARGDLSEDEAVLSAEVLARTDIDCVPHRHLMGAAMRISVALQHPAYDCFYLALAESRGLRMVTADERLLRKIGQTRTALPDCLSLGDVM